MRTAIVLAALAFVAGCGGKARPTEAADRARRPL
jgi:hypothetical protein